MKSINPKKISVLGLGYVGLPIALEFSKKFKTIGYDINEKKIFQIKKEINFSKKLNLTNKKKDLKNSDFFIVTVQTPIDKKKNPNLKYLKEVTKTIGKSLKKGSVVIYESTVYPGVTENICGKILEKYSKYKINKDFYLGYSPERISPGDKQDISRINKLVSGSDIKTSLVIKSLYQKIIKAKIHTTKTIKIAEMSKLVENAQRDINISFMNEISLICDKLKIETHDVLKAANTKWNFLDFKPGLVGGHCISVDPFYLTHISKKNRYNPRVILSGRNINDKMGIYVAKKILFYLKINKIKNPKIGILGLTFKENCSDFRGSKVMDIIDILKKRRINFDTYDPVINDYEIRQSYPYIINTKLNDKYDILLISVKHNFFKKFKIKNLKNLLKNNQSILFDLKSIFNKKILKKNNIKYWSL